MCANDQLERIGYKVDVSNHNNLIALINGYEYRGYSNEERRDLCHQFLH